MSLVDSYRRRGKKPKPFPTRDPETVAVGDGEVTTYTFGRDLYDDMIAAIDGAQRQILFETYIWKGDATGERFKRALAAAADRGVEVYCIYDGFANLVVAPTFKRFPSSMKVLRYPIYAAGWRFFDLRRYGRDHRKILVVDDHTGFIGGYNIGSAYETEWRDTHVRVDRARRVGPQARVRGLLEPQPAAPAPRLRASAAARDGLDVGAARSGSSATCRGCGCSRSAGCTSRPSTGPAATSG